MRYECDAPELLPPINVPYTAQVFRRPALANLFTAMGAFGWFAVTRCVESRRRMKRFRDVLKEPPLVAFDRKDVISFVFNDFFDDLTLRAHRLRSDDTPLKVEHVEKFRYGGNFVGLAIYFSLTEDNTVCRCESIYKMKRLLTVFM